MKSTLGILALLVCVGGPLLLAWLLAGAIGLVLTGAVFYQCAQSFRPDLPRGWRALGWAVALSAWGSVVVLHALSGVLAWLLAVAVWGLLFYPYPYPYGVRGGASSPEERQH
jgi:hypothetical protein